MDASFVGSPNSCSTRCSLLAPWFIFVLLEVGIRASWREKLRSRYAEFRSARPS
jgi:hypothetical protein